MLSHTGSFTHFWGDGCEKKKIDLEHMGSIFLKTLFLSRGCNPFIQRLPLAPFPHPLFEGSSLCIPLSPPPSHISHSTTVRYHRLFLKRTPFTSPSLFTQRKKTEMWSAHDRNERERHPGICHVPSAPFADISEPWGKIRETLSHCDTVLFVVGKSNLSFQKSMGKMKLLRDFFPLRVKFAIGQEKVASDP